MLTPVRRSLAFPQHALTFEHSPIHSLSDINTPETTSTGNLHGCPVSFLLGLPGTDVAPFNEWVKPRLDKKSLVYIGLRDVDAGEKKILKEHGIKVRGRASILKVKTRDGLMPGVDDRPSACMRSTSTASARSSRWRSTTSTRRGTGLSTSATVRCPPPPTTARYGTWTLALTPLRTDVDALDPLVAPSTGTPVRGGLTFREGHFITEAVAETGLLVGCVYVPCPLVSLAHC